MLKLYSYSWLIILFLFFSCSSKKEEYKVRRSSLVEAVYASGIVKSRNQYTVYPKVSGILQDIFVDDGELVNSKQILFSIENENSKISKKNALLFREYNSLENQKDKLNELALQVNILKNKFINDSINFTRQKALWSKKIISDFDYEQAELIFKNSKTQLQSIQNKYDDLNKQLQFNARQSNNSFQLSETNENDFIIKSNIQGIVFDIFKNKGEFVSPQTPIAVIGSDKNYYVELQIDEKDISKISVGQNIMIKLDSYPNNAYDAKVKKIIPYLNEKNKTFIVEAEFSKFSNKLYPNLSLEANIIIRKRDNVIVIPSNFLSDKNEVTLKNGQSLKVKIGLKNFDFVEIISGLKVNEIIISQ